MVIKAKVRWQINGNGNKEARWFIIKMVCGAERGNRLFQGLNVIFWKKAELCEEWTFKILVHTHKMA
jgi:hypothetical protein